MLSRPVAFPRILERTGYGARNSGANWWQPLPLPAALRGRTARGGGGVQAGGCGPRLTCWPSQASSQRWAVSQGPGMRRAGASPGPHELRRLPEPAPPCCVPHPLSQSFGRSLGLHGETGGVAAVWGTDLAPETWVHANSLRPSSWGNQAPGRPTPPWPPPRTEQGGYLGKNRPMEGLGTEPGPQIAPHACVLYRRAGPAGV